jgi:hypothetical protein
LELFRPEVSTVVTEEEIGVWLLGADGGTITVVEESVKAEEDWGDPDKIKTREINVEIPAAG